MRISFTKVKSPSKTIKNNNKIVINISGIEKDRIRYNLPFYILDADWKNGFPKQVKELMGIRNTLNSLKRHLEDWYNKNLEENNVIMNGDVIEELQYFTGVKKRNYNLFEALDECYKHKCKENGEARSTHFEQLKRRLLNYDKNLTFSIINTKKFHKKLIYEVFAYKMNRPAEAAQKTSVNNSIEVYNHFMKYAYDEEMLIEPPKMIKKLKVKEQIIIVTEPEELEILEDAKFNLQTIKGKRYDIVRDLYLMACYTGLRYSDVMFDGSNAKGNTVEVTINKTKDLFKLHLIPEAIAILKKYNWKLPQIGKTHFNVQLKEVAKELNLNREVTQLNQLINAKTEFIKMPFYKHIRVHTGRKTFVTNCLNSEISPMQAMKLSNHNSWDSFMRYVKFADKQLAKEIQKISKQGEPMLPEYAKDSNFIPLTEQEIKELEDTKEPLTELEILEEELRISEMKLKIQKMKKAQAKEQKEQMNPNLKAV